jgi:NADH-quinone oxidoreductase subunit N
MNAPSAKDLLSIAPQLIVSVAGMLVLLLDAVFPRISKRALAYLSVLGLIIAGVMCARPLLHPPSAPVQPTLQGMVMADGYTAFFSLIFILGTALSMLLSTAYLEREAESHGEYYALMLFTTLGAMVMAASINLICVFIGLEILSISLYILAGYQTDRLESDESAMKYFLLGAFASAFFLYGIALVFGATGSLDIYKIGAGLEEAFEQGMEPGKNYLLLGGVAMMLVGFGFKVAVVPFHIWTPDVYEGAPTPVTAFMSVGAKAAGFAAFLRVLVTGFKDQGVQLQVSAVLASIAALTMLVGNVVAVVQTNVKRLLAYSSIAHAGYILVGLVAAVRPGGGVMPQDTQGRAISAVLFYTLAYTLSNLGAFGVLLALQKRGEELREIDDFAGVGYRHPLLGALMCVFLLSLAGLPPFPGFFGKLFLLQAMIGMESRLVWLIVLFVLTSVVSFYYYLAIVRAMYMDHTGADAGSETRVVADVPLKLALGLSGLGTLLLGLWAGGALEVAQTVAKAFFHAGPPSAMR